MIGKDLDLNLRMNLGALEIVACGNVVTIVFSVDIVGCCWLLIVVEEFAGVARVTSVASVARAARVARTAEPPFAIIPSTFSCFGNDAEVVKWCPLSSLRRLLESVDEEDRRL